MGPIDVTYDISRCYINDLQDVEPALLNKIRGYHRARSLADLASCSRHFDAAKHTIREWRSLRQIEAFFKKNSVFSQKKVCKDAARLSFFEAEAECSVTNRRLRPFVRNRRLLDDETYAWVGRMRRYVSDVLGDFHCFLDVLPSLVRVTSGATAHAARKDSLPQMKMRTTQYCTSAAAPLLKAVAHTYGFPNLGVKRALSNRVELVPKNWKTDRTIACEPEGNLPLQLAFDTYAKRRLRRRGIDLSDQSANQRAAKHGSVHNDLVTVDFSRASDTISFNTVSLVFPEDWFGYLLKVRTPCYRGVFGDGIYAKFSSMGNGSTFAIETLIFAAACYAVGSRNFLVYGDDVIIEKEYYGDYIRLTRFLGFTINLEKSFNDGPFRESCGADYFDGIDVTPVYIRNVDRRKALACHLVNTLASIALPGGELEKYLLSFMRRLKLPLVPYNESTLSGVWISPERARALKILKRNGDVDRFKAYTARYKRRCFVDCRGYYLWWLYKNSQVLFSAPWEVTARGASAPNHSETSSAPVFDHAYVRKRVCWHPPAEAIPDHLYWWSDLASRA